jgi:hypothetical protein
MRCELSCGSDVVQLATTANSPQELTARRVALSGPVATRERQAAAQRQVRCADDREGEWR